jgi:hypothetical protein
MPPTFISNPEIFYNLFIKTIILCRSPDVAVNLTKETVRESEETTIACNARDGNPQQILSYQWEFRRPDSTIFTVLSDT